MNLKEGNVLLINPNPTRYEAVYQENKLEKEYFQTRGQVGIELGDQRTEPNNGLLSIGRSLLKYGYNVTYLDLNAIEIRLFEKEKRYLTLKELEKIVLENLQGITTVLLSSLTCSFGVCLKIAEIVKEFRKDIPVILGGIFPSLNLDYCMEKSNNIDSIVIGEGECIAPKIIHYLLTGNDKFLENQKGFFLKQNGTSCRVPGHNIITDLDILGPPAFELIDPEMPPIFRVFTSRGCSSRCSFCAPSFMAKHTVRGFSPDRIIETLRWIKEDFGVDYFLIGDLTFLDNQYRSRVILEKIIEADLGMKFWCQTRLDRITERNLELLKKAGCVQIAIGLESYNSDILRMASKGISPDKMVERLLLTRKFDLQVQGYFIVGLPWEKEENIDRTIRFIEYSLEKGFLDLTHISVYVPYPGLPLTEQVEIIDKNYNHYYQGVFLDMPPKPVYKTDHLLPDRVIALWQKLLRQTTLSLQKRIANNHQQVRLLSDVSSNRNMYILGADALTIAGEVEQEAKKGKKKSVFNIVQGIKTTSGSYVSRAVIEDERYVIGFTEIYSAGEVAAVIDAIDGIVDIIHLDIDGKNGKSHEIIETALSKVKKSEIYTYSDLETVFKSILYIIQEEKGKNPFDLNISILESTEYSLKLGNYLKQFGYHINFCKEKDLIELQKVQSPESPSVLITYCLNSPFVDHVLINSMPANSLVIDASMESIREDLHDISSAKNITLRRPDIRSMVLSEIYLSEHYQKVTKDSKGKRFLRDFCLVSGGLVGKDGDIVVDNVNDGKRVFGVADGKGRLKNHGLLTEKDRERLSYAIDELDRTPDQQSYYDQ